MTFSTHTFKLIRHYGEDQMMSQLEANWKSRLDWCFLNIGAWTNIARSTAGTLRGSDFSVLRAVDDPQYTDGQVWEAPRKDWAWEDSVNYEDVDGNTGLNPISVGTPYIGAVAVTAPYHINYPLGRVIFDTAISTSSVVTIAYPYRNVQVKIADDAPWLREMHFRSYRPEGTQFEQFGKGDWAINGQHRVQLPTVVVECVPRGYSSGYEMGSGGLRLFQDMIFHVVAEDRRTRNDIVDAIKYQDDVVFDMFDSNDVAAASAYALDYRGEKTGTNMYPDLVDDYTWDKCMMKNTVVSEIESQHINLYEGVVRATMEVIR